MHKTEWLNCLKGNRDIAELPPEKQVWVRWKIRSKVKEAMDLIIYAAENLPGKELDLIFLKHNNKTNLLLRLVSSQRVWQRTHYYVTQPDRTRRKTPARDLTKNPYSNSSNSSAKKGKR